MDACSLKVEKYIIISCDPNFQYRRGHGLNIYGVRYLVNGQDKSAQPYDATLG